MPHHSDENRESPQPDDCHSSLFDYGLEFGRGIEMGFAFGNIEAQKPGRQNPAGESGNEEEKEIGKLPFARGPGHQCGDVTEGAPGTPGVGGDHDVDSPGDQKFTVGFVDGEKDRRENQRRREVVGDGRDEEGQKSGQPEEFLVTVPFGDELELQRVEDSPLD